MNKTLDKKLDEDILKSIQSDTGLTEEFLNQHSLCEIKKETDKLPKSDYDSSLGNDVLKGISSGDDSTLLVGGGIITPEEIYKKFEKYFKR